MSGASRVINDRAGTKKGPLERYLPVYHGLASEAALHGADRYGLASEATLHGADRYGLASEATLHLIIPADSRSSLENSRSFIFYQNEGAFGGIIGQGC